MVVLGKAASLRGGGEGLLFWRMIMSSDLSLILAEVQALRVAFEGIQDALSTTNEKLTPLERTFANAIPSLPVKILFTQHFHIHSFIGENLTIHCLNTSLLDLMNKQPQRIALEKAAESVFSKDVFISIGIGSRDD